MRRRILLSSVVKACKLFDLTQLWEIFPLYSRVAVLGRSRFLILPIKMAQV